MNIRRRAAVRVAVAAVAVLAPIVVLTVPGTFASAAGPIIVSPLDHFPNGETEDTFQGPVPRADCGPGSDPETGMQGQVTVADRESGRSSEGYSCNMEEVGNYGPDDPQGFEGAEWQFARYGDCGYYSQRLVGGGLPPVGDLPDLGDPEILPQERPGTIVVDMSDPEDPKFAGNLTTLGMMDPWETLKVNKERGLLAAVNVLDFEGAAFFDVYDVTGDCTKPTLLSSSPVSVVNHEGNFSTDGMTYYSGGLQPGLVSAIDVSDPTKPELITTFFAKLGIHGMSTSQDGNRMYLAHINEDWPTTLTFPGNGNGDVQSTLGGNGMGIYDISEIQERKANPQVSLVSALEWQDGQIGQQTLNVFRDGVPHVIHVDEAGHGGARIIDISDETAPTVISKIKTEIMMPENVGTATAETKRLPAEKGGLFGFGYNIHYCNVDTVDDPSMLACSAFNQGVRVFDIRDFSAPREIAYFNPGGDGTLQPGSFGGTYSGYPAAMPQFVPERQELWFTDQDRGVFVTRFTNDTWISDIDSSDDISHGN